MGLETVRILVADDESKVRSALRLILSQEPDFILVGEVVEARLLPLQIRLIQPDLLLLDWELPGFRNPQFLGTLFLFNPSLKIIALSVRPEAEEEAINAGASAFVFKGDPPEHLISAVRRVSGFPYNSYLL